MKVCVILKNEAEETIETDIDLTLGASQNAKIYFDNRAKLKIKEEKTIAATQQSLKKANQSAIAEIKRQKLQTRKKKVMAHRKALWFEKFFWFLSSENFLIITAHDAQQNEVLIKRYLKQNDIVFHAHIEGAAFTIVKNNSDKPIPLMTIMEAANATLAHSQAWDDKVVVQVYWVHANQVSKSAPSGMFLPTGSFMIYGKKNFVQPFKLEMGYGILFKVGDENIPNHKNERTIKEDLESDELQPIKLQTQQPTEKTENTVFSELEKVVKENQPEDFTQVQIQKKAKPSKVVKQKDKTQKKKKEEKPAIKENPKPKNPNKKLSKLQKDKIQNYLEKHGDEDREEQELRMKILGTKKNYKLEEEKKAFVWNQTKTKEEFILEGGELVEIKLVGEPVQEQTKTNKNEQLSKVDVSKTQKKEKEIADFVEGMEEDTDDINYSNLTGIPFKDDCLYEVYPVCAPYSTLLKYKYKIKIIPGNMKRGKVLKLAVDLFSGQSDVNEVI